MSTNNNPSSQQHTQTLEESTESSSPDQVELTYGTRERCVCLSCGTEVPQDVGRVYGNNNDNVRACERCWTDAQGHKSAASHASAAMHALTEDRL